MPHITSGFTIADGLATVRTFAPQSIGMDHSRFAYKRLTQKFTWVTLDVKWSDSTPKRPTVRQEVATDFPVIRAVSGVDTKIGAGRAITTYIIPDEMTEDEVKDLRAFHINALGIAVIASGTTQREPIWG